MSQRESDSNPSTAMTGSVRVLITDRLVITVTVVLLSSAAVAWYAAYSLMQNMTQMAESSSIFPSSSSNMMMVNSAQIMGVASMISSLSLNYMALFELAWVIGMVAMMFPAMIPVVFLYNKVATKLESNPKVAILVGTPLFLLGYLAVYAALGIGAYLAVYGAISLLIVFPQTAFFSQFAPSLVLIMAGVYQLTPLKDKCLSHCVSPIGFFLAHGKRGLSGSLQMGLNHGYYCAGCCWLYMLVMLAVAAMSLPSMAILTGLIAFEKVVVKGRLWFTKAIATGFLLLGIYSIFYPTILNFL
jgi:predicted metal-binding membrane protein